MKENNTDMNYQLHVRKFARLKMCAMAFTKSCNKNNCFFYFDFFSLVNNFQNF